MVDATNIPNNKGVERFSMDLRRKLPNSPPARRKIGNGACTDDPLAQSIRKDEALQDTFRFSDLLSPLTKTSAVRQRSSSTSSSTSSSSTLSDLHYTPEEEALLLDSMFSNQAPPREKYTYNGRGVPALWIPPVNPLSKNQYASMDRSLYKEPEINVKSFQERVREYDDFRKTKEVREGDEKEVGQNGETLDGNRVESIAELQQRILVNKEERLARDKALREEKARAEYTRRISQWAADASTTYPTPPSSATFASTPSPSLQDASPPLDQESKSVPEPPSPDRTVSEPGSPLQNLPEPVALIPPHLSYTHLIHMHPKVTKITQHIATSFLPLSTLLQLHTYQALQTSIQHVIVNDPSGLGERLYACVGGKSKNPEKSKEWWRSPVLHIGFGDRFCEETLSSDDGWIGALGRLRECGGRDCYVRAEWNKVK